MNPSTSPVTTARMLDLTRDLGQVARLGTSVGEIDRLLGEALEALGGLVPFDLATVLQLEGDELAVRVARGTLAGPEVRRHRISLAAFPSIREVLREGHARAFGERDHAEGDGDPFDGVLDLPHGHCCMVVPLIAGSGALGLMTFDRRECGGYPPGLVELADVNGKLLALAMSYGEQSVRLERLRRQIEEQNRVLRERVDGSADPCRLIEASTSPSMVHVAHLARQVAATDAPVLISGETGTGKEVLAKAIHRWSERADRPMVSINCAALPATLIESELFGHVKGAFSGATGSRVGRFQAANGGTFFLDEVGEIPLDLQPKLLRVLQEGCFEPVGSDRTVRVDVRLITATNVDLQAAVDRGTFRDDLYYRLAVFPIALPPLRARREDIGGIARSFLAELSQRTGRGPWELSEESLGWMERQRWRGNVRELVNTLERATILSPTPLLELGTPDDDAIFPSAPGPSPWAGIQGAPFPTLREMERRHIERALRRTGGKLYGGGGAAELLGIHASTLRSRMDRLGMGGARDFQERRGRGPAGLPDASKV